MAWLCNVLVTAVQYIHYYIIEPVLVRTTPHLGRVIALSLNVLSHPQLMLISDCLTLSFMFFVYRTCPFGVTHQHCRDALLLMCH